MGSRTFIRKNGLKNKIKRFNELQTLFFVLVLVRTYICEWRRKETSLAFNQRGHCNFYYSNHTELQLQHFYLYDIVDFCSSSYFLFLYYYLFFVQPKRETGFRNDGCPHCREAAKGVVIDFFLRSLFLLWLRLCSRLIK